MTFNYDLLLEHAARDAIGFREGDLSEYGAANGFSIVKLHGSVNWMREIEGWSLGTGSLAASYVQTKVISRARDLKASDRYVVVKDHQSPRGGDKGATPLYPAIAIPVEKKSSFECPAEHLERLDAQLPAASALIVVGWRATEFHFLERWKSLQSEPIPRNRALIICGSKEGARETEERLTNAGVLARHPKGTEAWGDNFSNALATGEVERFLQRL